MLQGEVVTEGEQREIAGKRIFLLSQQGFQMSHMFFKAHLFQIHSSPPIFYPLKRNLTVITFGNLVLYFPYEKVINSQAFWANESEGSPRIFRNHVQDLGRVF